MTTALGVTASEPRALDRARAALGWAAKAGVALHVFSLPISMAGMQIGFAVAAIALVALRLTGAPVRRRSFLDAPFLAFVGAAILSQLFAFQWLGSDAFLWKTLLSPLVIVFTLGLDEAHMRRDALRLLGLWAVAAAIPSLIAWPQYFTGFDPLYALGLRAKPLGTGLYGVHFAMGFSTAYTRFAHSLLAPVSVLAAVGVVLGGWRRTLALTVSLLACAAIGLTFARAAWIGLAVAAAVLALFVGWKRALAGAAVVGVVGALLVAFHPGVRTRFVSSFEFSQNRDRMGIWQVCSEVRAEHPLAGVGFGNLPIAARAKYESNPITGPLYETSKRRCHNTFFTSLVEGGPLLFAASIFLFAGPAWSFFRLRRRADRLGAAACAGALATLASMLVNSFVHDPLYASEAGFAFCFALAIATAIATAPPKSL